MAPITTRKPNECAYDVVTLGEVMLRLDPGEMRIHTARNFRAWEGGGEYNVGRNLRRAFNKRTAVITGLVDNSIGRLIEDLILNGGVDTQFIHWAADDGLGRSVRNGLNFTERGFGLRGGLGCSDRANTAASQLRPEDIDLDYLFGELGVRWLHTGGIFAALSSQSGKTLLRVIEAARANGTIVSFDSNFRPSLWKAHEDPQSLQALNRTIAENVDVMVAGPYDYQHCLGLDIDANDGSTEEEATEKMVELNSKYFPNIAVLARTSRIVHDANNNDWGAIAWSEETGVIRAANRRNVPILDRVGGGDAFAAGLFYGLMENLPLSEALEYGTASGALAMATPGDYSMAFLRDIEQLKNGASAATSR